jgi:hypothetical protein
MGAKYRFNLIDEGNFTLGTDERQEQCDEDGFS